ncbi:MAG: calcium/sodium antiporter [Calditrichaeota bacterium]|nr:calcium/sodium antiporter [Calditrichota bacterium]
MMPEQLLGVSGMPLQIAYLLVGVGLLWIGADLLVKNASQFATAVGVSPIIVGLSVVSLGTSAPELVVSLMAAFKHSAGLSIGNIIGSNIANIGLILGVGAIITPLNVEKSWVKREVPFMIGVTLVFSFIAYRGYELNQLDGVVLLGLMVAFMYYLARYARKEMNEFKEIQRELLHQDSPDVQVVSVMKKLGYLLGALLGLGILILGSNITVNSGKTLAVMLGVSDMIIGLTLIAIGTSLPELATTIVGAIRKETDIVVGNVIGSNIFNLLLIGGVVAIIHPVAIQKNLFFINIPMLIFTSLIVLPIMRIKLNIQRYEGFFLLALYVLFIYLTFRV